MHTVTISPQNVRHSNGADLSYSVIDIPGTTYFIAKKITAACVAIISGIPTINLVWRVLWRMMSMAASIAADPPIRDSASSELSRILFCGRCFAAHLSYTVTITDISDISAKYAAVIAAVDCAISDAGMLLYFLGKLSLRPTMRLNVPGFLVSLT